MMETTGVFFKPQRGKANKGVKISHLNPETRINSKFRQGTNLMMRPVRGVGDWIGLRTFEGLRSSTTAREEAPLWLQQFS